MLELGRTTRFRWLRDEDDVDVLQQVPGTLEVLVAGLLLLTMTTGASLAWLIYLLARYRLFRWDRP